MFVTDTGPVLFAAADDDEHRALDGLARSVLHCAGGAVDSPEFVAAAAEVWEEAPAGLRKVVRRYRRYSQEGGVLVLRNLPVGAELGPTPVADGSIQRTASVSAAVLLMVAHGMGDPAAFRAEKSGALVQNVVPVPGREDTQANTGSVRLTFHTENAFHEHRPDFVMLLCLRPDHEGIAELRTCCARQIAPKLSTELFEVLTAAEFCTEPPPSFASGSGAAEPHPVLPGDTEDPDLRVDEAATRALTGRATAAMDELSALFDQSYQAMRLRTGDLAIVDNRVVVHGRSAFTPRYDGADRWLQRSFVLADHRRSRRHRTGDSNVLEW